MTSVAEEKPLYRYKEDILPSILITALFLADLAVYLYLDNIWLVIVWVLLGLGPKACICAWNHHHQHVPTFRSQFLNRVYELVFSFHTGITTNTWVLHHNLGHHLNYLDQDKDESGWKRKDGKKMGVVEYTWTIAATGYYRAYQVGKRHPRFQSGFLQMGVVVALILGIMFWINWLSALLVFMIPMLIGYVITCWHTYYHHAGLEADDHFHASYNIIHKWYNILTGNLGYHTAHHMKQAVHWSRLPELHSEIEDKIPTELYRRPCIPFRWMPAQ